MKMVHLAEVMLCDQAANEKKGPIDFAIITALKLERDAVLRRLDEGYEQVQEDEEPLTYYYGHITIPSSGERYSVVFPIFKSITRTTL